MYVPDHFRAPDGEIDAVVRAGGFAHLVTATASAQGPGLVSTPLPLLYDGESHALLGHVARTNEHWRHAGAGESLAIFPGPDAYVSPGWYPSKAEHGRVVPTWNYEVVHVHGRLVAHDDVDWLHDLVARLTARHEAARRDEQLAADGPWSADDAPASFLAGQLRAIVGLELQITRVEGKAKLSQNRPPADRDSVQATLARSPEAGDRDVARRMKEHDPQRADRVTP